MHYSPIIRYNRFRYLPGSQHIHTVFPLCYSCLYYCQAAKRGKIDLYYEWTYLLCGQKQKARIHTYKSTLWKPQNSFPFNFIKFYCISSVLWAYAAALIQRAHIVHSTWTIYTKFGITSKALPIEPYGFRPSVRLIIGFSLELFETSSSERIINNHIKYTMHNTQLGLFYSLSPFIYACQSLLEFLHLFDKSTFRIHI